MENQTNYYKLGLFVIVGLTLLLAGLVLLGVGRFGQKKIYIETYFDESVQGLSSGSAVHYRGFPIGKVEKIAFVTQYYNFPMDSELYSKYLKYVMVLISINSEELARQDEASLKKMLTSMAKEGARIRLTQQPLTGLSYLDIDFLDPNQYPPMELDWKPDNWYMPSAPSLLSTFTQSAEEAFKQLAQVDIAKLSKDADDMMVAVKTAFQEAQVKEVSRQLQAFLREAEQTGSNLKNMLAAGGASSMATLPETIDRFEKTLVEIQTLLQTRSGDFGRIINNVKHISQNIRDLTDKLKRQPSTIIYSDPPEKSEVLK